MGKHPALTFIKGESQTIGGFGRNDRFSYKQLFGGAGEVANRVLVEAGTASGREPTATVELRSYLSRFLRETGFSLGADDEGPFTMRVLLPDGYSIPPHIHPAVEHITVISGTFNFGMLIFRKTRLRANL